MTGFTGAHAVLASPRTRLGDTLVEMGLIGDAELSSALERQAAAPGQRLGVVLRDMGFITESDLARGLAQLHRLPIVDVDLLNVDRDAARLVPRAMAQRLAILAYRRTGDTLHVAIADPIDVVALDDVRAVSRGLNLEIGVATPSVISRALTQVWAEHDEADVLRAFIDETTVAVTTHTVEDDDDAVTIRLVDRLLSQAVRQRASDLHIEPRRDGVHVRLRIDGILREVMTVPRSGYAALTARLKIVADLDVIERRLPQDGRARIRLESGPVDVRVSTLPSMHGETVVVRVLPPAAGLPGMAGLGIDAHQREIMVDAVARPQGLILITGPTGSGKTNTLYATIAEGVDVARNAITLEDPVEIELPGLTQVQIDERSGLDFARGLRACLRQDPDVILVGEIRDRETAELAVRAALTGHLVLSTLHTVDSAAAVTRLTDMGIAPYLVTSSLVLVASQRLVRVPCRECSSTDPDAMAVLELLGVTDVGGTWLRAVGCTACANTGYHGRTAVVELMPITKAIRNGLLHGATEQEVRVNARDDGVASLHMVGLEKARRGETTLAEVLRVVPLWGSD
jgi:type IV pilus assembly protein PilB